MLGVEKTKMKAISPALLELKTLVPVHCWRGKVLIGVKTREALSFSMWSPDFPLESEKLESSGFQHSALFGVSTSKISTTWLFIPQVKETHHHVAFSLPSARPFQRHTLQYSHGLHRNSQAHPGTPRCGQALQRRRSCRGSVRADG